ARRRTQGPRAAEPRQEPYSPGAHEWIFIAQQRVDCRHAFGATLRQARACGATHIDRRTPEGRDLSSNRSGVDHRNDRLESFWRDPVDSARGRLVLVVVTAD